jgi:hypothetical protein
MPNLDQKKALASVGMFVLPMVIVKLIAAMLGAPGLTRAEASQPTESTEPTNAPPTAVNPIAWTAQQLAAAAHVEQLDSQSFGPSPLYYEPVSEEAPAPAAAPVKDNTPAFMLKAVMGTSRGSKAIINGKPYSAGETVRGTEWLVESIDCDARSVVLKDGNSGRTLTVNVEKLK